MAYIGIVENRPGIEVTVKLHGTYNHGHDGYSEIQLKNFVRALLNKHENKSPWDMATGIAEDAFSVYREGFLWTECNVKTDTGFICGVAVDGEGI